ncbi:MAG: hypothetical protein ABIH37_05620 [archaeon]
MNIRDIRKSRMNKKGAEMTIGTIIVIILAVVVLVVLVYGFSVGWGDLWNKIISFGGGQVNVQSAVQGCQIACSTQSTFEYCSKERSVIFEEGQKEPEKLNCYALQTRGVGLSCDRIDCIPVSCEGLKSTVCFRNNAELLGCSVDWKTSVEFKDAGENVGRGKVYKEVPSDVSGKVTDQQDIVANKGKVCVRLILN